MNPNILQFVVIIIVVLLVMFILLREFWCWYYKINSRKKIEEDILDSLNKQNVILQEISQKLTVNDKKKSSNLDIKI